MSGSHHREALAHFAERYRIGAVVGVIVFGDGDDNVHHVGKATATHSAFAERVINLCRYDQLPGVRIKEAGNDRLDVAFGDNVAVTDEHVALRSDEALNASGLNGQYT